MNAERAILETDHGSGKMYRSIKKRLSRFLETTTEKRLRVKGEWDSHVKPRGMTALQFEADWETVHAELVECGLGQNATEKFLGYTLKVGPPMSENIRLDRRPRADGRGGLVIGPPETRKECHEVLTGIEGVRAGSKALNAA